jgi:hypothetical protein
MSKQQLVNGLARLIKNGHVSKLTDSHGNIDGVQIDGTTSEAHEVFDLLGQNGIWTARMLWESEVFKEARQIYEIMDTPLYKAMREEE